MSAEGWPHGTHVSSARERRIAAFYPRIGTYSRIADMRELYEAGVPLDEIACAYEIEPSRLRRILAVEQ